MNHDNIGMLYCQRSPQMPKRSLDELFYHMAIKLSRQSCRFVLFVLNLPIYATKIIVTYKALYKSCSSLFVVLCVLFGHLASVTFVLNQSLPDPTHI